MGSSDKTSGLFGAFDRVKAAARELGDEVVHSGTLDKLKDAVKDMAEEPDKGVVLDRIKATVRDLGDDPETGGALDRLKSAFSDLGDEVEKTARDQWESAKPELKGSVNDLQGVVDAVAERAKGQLGNLSSKIDSAGKRES